MARETSVMSTKIPGGGIAGASFLAALAVAASACGEARSPSSDGGSGAPTTSCVTCHGDASRLPASISAAPPIDTRGNTGTSAAGRGRAPAPPHRRQHPARHRLLRMPPRPDDRRPRAPAARPHLGSARVGPRRIAILQPGEPDLRELLPRLPGGWRIGHGAGMEQGRRHAGRLRRLPRTSTDLGPPGRHGGRHDLLALPRRNREPRRDHRPRTRASPERRGRDLAGSDELHFLPRRPGPPPRIHRRSAPDRRVRQHLHLRPGRGRTPAPPRRRQRSAARSPAPSATSYRRTSPTPPSRVDLTWGPLARADGALPTWNGTALTCANYCHGSTMAGGALTAPVWNRVDGTQAACGSCHGLPPAAPHPAVRSDVTGCAGCHAGTVNPDGTILVAGGLHVNGVVDIAGGPGRAPGATATPPERPRSPPHLPWTRGATPRPPRRGWARTSVTSPAARCVARSPAPTATPFPPTSRMPASLSISPGENWPGRTGPSPTFSDASLTCANYCHGSTIAGGTLTSPVWNRVDGTQAACGTCHGLPPASPHPVVSGGVTACAICHAGTVNPDGTVKAGDGPARQRVGRDRVRER